MASKEQPKNTESVARRKDLGKFLPGGELGPLHNREEYEERLKTLPEMQQEFALETARFADLWQYFAEHKMQLPDDVVIAIGDLSKLAQKEQVSLLRTLNQKLMECLHAVSEDSGIRH